MAEDTAADPAEGTLALTAYRIAPHAAAAPEPAERRRAWMDDTDARFANRCLPLLMANQAGWWIRNSHTFVARWGGENEKSGLEIRYAGERGSYPAVSHFGYGIVTFHIPLLMRTPPGWNLLARGPANLPKDAAAPLEGLVETDWAVSTFTMNWQITRPDTEVEFRAGEPICMLVPQRRGELERFRPDVLPFERMPDAGDYESWQASRTGFLVGERPEGTSASLGWQRDYMLGVVSDGTPPFTEHQRRLDLHQFTDEPDPEPPSGVRCAPPSPAVHQ
jgi:hypothetical protein